MRNGTYSKTTATNYLLNGFDDDRVLATDITDPDLIQKILDHIAAQPPPVNIATARQP